MKRLKTRRERSLVRGGWKETSNTKSHRHHHRHQSSKDMAHFHNCCHSSCHCPSVKETQFPSVAPAAAGPSIITDSRLIGHHGLFNHEVKSIDIERLLSEQRKLKQSGRHVKEQCNATSHLSSSSGIPAPFSSDGLLERSCGPQYQDNNIQPFFSHRAQLPDRHSAEPTHFPQEQDPRGTNRYSFSPLFPPKIPHFYQSNYLLPFSQFRQPLACPLPRSHHTDMTHYPPSQMLERSTAPPLSSLPSPEHWSFPAMRLY
uniref:Uncharacterized protein n=1 Tax=Stegastes partitus TaxID=144197 RepID=A0A3B4ZAN2_9TELE